MKWLKRLWVSVVLFELINKNDVYGQPSFSSMLSRDQNRLWGMRLLGLYSFNWQRSKNTNNIPLIQEDGENRQQWFFFFKWKVLQTGEWLAGLLIRVNFEPPPLNYATMLCWYRVESPYKGWLACVHVPKYWNHQAVRWLIVAVKYNQLNSGGYNYPWNIDGCIVEIFLLSTHMTACPVSYWWLLILDWLGKSIFGKMSVLSSLEIYCQAAHEQDIKVKNGKNCLEIIEIKNNTPGMALHTCTAL